MQLILLAVCLSVAHVLAIYIPAYLFELTMSATLAISAAVSILISVTMSRATPDLKQSIENAVKNEPTAQKVEDILAFLAIMIVGGLTGSVLLYRRYGLTGTLLGATIAGIVSQLEL
jgi:hypothetical protein